ncbi:MAG: helix-turn-helix domain-containing protein, partial [Nitrospirota bacterium]
EIAVEDVPHEILMFSEGAEYTSDLTKEGVDLDRIIEDIEKKYLLNALKIADGNKTEAARLLNLSFRSFRHRLSKYGIK